jgi:hypothetical protein
MTRCNQHLLIEPEEDGNDPLYEAFSDDPSCETITQIVSCGGQIMLMDSRQTAEVPARVERDESARLVGVLAVAAAFACVLCLLIGIWLVGAACGFAAFLFLVAWLALHAAPVRDTRSAPDEL